MSSYGVMRGLHFQRPPFTQSKLVRYVKGRVIIIPSFLTLKEGSTFLTKPLFNSLYAPFGSPSSGGQKPSGARGCNRPTRCSEPLRSKVGGASKPSPCFAGWDRMGMIGDTTSEYDGVSATAVQSSSAFSAAIDRGTGGVEGVGIMEVCRGYHVYHARGVRYACLFGIGLEKRNLGIISKGCTGI